MKQTIFFLVFSGNTDVLFLFAMEGGFVGDTVAFDAPYFSSLFSVELPFSLAGPFAPFRVAASAVVPCTPHGWRFLGRRFVRRSSRLRFRVTFFGVLGIVRTFPSLSSSGSGRRNLLANFLRLCLFVEVVAGDFW